jgi:cellobiose phosphorylase
LTLFVPPDYDALVWDPSLTRREGGSAEMDVFAYVEHSQLNWDTEHSWGYYIKLMVKTWFDAASRSMNYLCHAGNPREKESPLVFLGSSAEVGSSCGSRNDFVGDYRSERNPVAVERGQCGNETINCGEAASALHNPVRLATGKDVRLLYVLDVAPSALVDLPAAEAARDAMLKALTDPAVVDAQAAKLDAWWQEQFGAMQCSIPDPAAERQINTWNVINSVHVGRYSRSVNTVAPGIRGIGFRDTCQDMLAVAYRRPQSAFQTLCFLLSQQYRDGHTVHYAFPEEKRPPVVTIHSDWNDIIGRFNRHGKGETVFAGMQYALCLRHMVELAAAADKPELAWLQDCLLRQERALLACAWDGGWWRRGFDDDGVPVGSEQCECGKLFLNPQSWAVLSGIGDRCQQEKGMSAANAMAGPTSNRSPAPPPGWTSRPPNIFSVFGPPSRGC